MTSVEKIHVEVANVLGASKLRTFSHVIWPSSLPSVFAGARVGLGFAWMCVVAAEMFAARSGLGYQIQLNRQLFQLDRVVAGMIAIAFVGYFMNRLMAGMEWWCVPWRREFLAADFLAPNPLSKTRQPPSRKGSSPPQGTFRASSVTSALSDDGPLDCEALRGTSATITDLHFSYPAGPPVLQGIDLGIAAGEVFCILGVSGCGKSTLLRLLAGLQAHYTGSVSIGGEVLQGYRPDVAMVFQNFSLFPWKTVEANVQFAIEQRPGSSTAARRDIREEVRQLLRLVGLPHKALSYPHHLSGGQQQRVALARALATRPRLLLLDEPFSALDALTRETLQEDVSTLLQHTGTTVIMVTHDIAEAVFMADRIGIMSSDGRILSVITVSANRPRSQTYRTSVEFRELVATLWEQLECQPCRV